MQTAGSEAWKENQTTSTNLTHVTTRPRQLGFEAELRYAAIDEPRSTSLTVEHFQRLTSNNGQ